MVDWCAIHDLTSSDHALVSFKIMTRFDARVESHETAKKYNWANTDWEKFRKSLREGRDAKSRGLESPDVDIGTVAFTEVLEMACVGCYVQTEL